VAPLFAGTLLLPNREVEGWLAIEGGKVAGWGEGDPNGRVDGHGWIVPTPVNAHTHAADTFLRDAEKPQDVAELVGPGGFKHQHLARASPQQLQQSFRSLATEMANAGTTHFIDFREGGIAGARLLAECPDLDAAPVVLGRPGQVERFDEREAEDLLAVAHGAGLSGMRDLPRRVLEGWAEACHAAKKPLAIHVSEDRRDDIDAVLALEPDFVVHMVHATRADLDAVADAAVAIVVCPRSNQFFGLRAPVAAMLEADIQVALGTDNGMLASGNVLDEIPLLKAQWPGVAEATWLRMATHNGRELLSLPPSLPPKRGQAANLMVLPEKPFSPAARKPALGVP
jgi:cytosine/adenosine deaminase-related metal-dependent hydrolase